MIEYSIKRNPLTGNLVIRFTCPKCSEKLTSSLKKAGQNDHCPTCKHTFILPGEAELSEELSRKKRLEEQESEARSQRLQASLNSAVSPAQTPPVPQPLPTNTRAASDFDIELKPEFQKGGLSQQLAVANPRSSARKKGKAGVVDWFERLLFSFARCIAYFVVLGVLIAIGYLGFQVLKSWALVRENRIELREVKELVFPEDAKTANGTEERTDEKNESTRNESSFEKPEARLRRRYRFLSDVKIPPNLLEQILRNEGEVIIALQGSHQRLLETGDFSSLVDYAEAFLEEVKADSNFRNSPQSQRELLFGFLSQQVDELNLAQRNRKAAKAESAMALTSLFFLFQLFILVSVVLVLFTIERNTRQ